MPPRVSAEVKAGWSTWSAAVGGGWSAAAACRILEVNPGRVSRWRDRWEAGQSLADATPGPEVALHGLLDWERDVIIEVYDDWAEVDGGYRKLAHRGSRLGVVFVSESSVYRVLDVEGLLIPTRLSRPPTGAKKPWPDWAEYRPNQVWGHDFSTFERADRDVLALIDLVSRYWIDFLMAPAGQGVSEHVTARTAARWRVPT